MSTRGSAEEKIIQGLEDFADALASGGDLSERFTCRQVTLDLEQVAYTPEKVKAARSELGLSQALFAKFLGASLNAVKAWEQGQRDPSPIACRFMDEILHNPAAFRQRFVEMTRPTGST